MGTNLPVKLLFWVAAAYDGLLGLVFLLLPGLLFERCDVPPPNHLGYVRFPAALLVVFGVMFVAIARRPLAGRNLIPYGIMLKVAYCGVVFYYWIAQGIPGMWKLIAVADLVFALLFAWAYMSLGRTSRAQAELS